jgi:hypothetical protein
MSGAILITVANLLWKTHNRLPSSAFWSASGEVAAPIAKPMADISNESDQFALPQRSRPQAANPILRSIPRRRLGFR